MSDVVIAGITVTLEIMAKEGVVGVHFDDDDDMLPTLVSAAGEQLFTVAEIVSRIREVLVDVTKHDDTLMWRITAVDPVERMI